MIVSGDVSRRIAHTKGADEWVRGLMDRIDARDTNGWIDYLGDDARFCFGNAPPVLGKIAIQNAANAFFSTLSAINHDIAETWMLPGAVIFRGKVRYTRVDGRILTVPFANVLKLDGEGLIREYLIYADISRL